MNVYELIGVHRRFSSESGGEVAAVAGIDLTIGQGERVALLGPSGAGKTSLLRLLNGILSPSSGEIRFAGQTLKRMSDHDIRAIRSRIGAIHQADSLVGQLPVLQNVLAGACGRQKAWQVLRTRISPPRAEVERARACLDRVGIGDKWQEPTFALSGGQRQRAALARVLYQDPAVILADEPVSALDRTLAQEVVELLVGLSGDRTLVVSLHAVDLALRHFSRVIGLKQGRVAFDLPPDRIGERRLADLFGPDPGASPDDGSRAERPVIPIFKPVL